MMVAAKTNYKCNWNLNKYTVSHTVKPIDVVYQQRETVYRVTLVDISALCAIIQA